MNRKNGVRYKRLDYKYQLVVWKPGLGTRSLSYHYVYLNRAIREGAHRCLRGGSKFEVWQVRPETRKLGYGDRDGHAVTFTWTDSAQKEVQHVAPMNWPAWLTGGRTQ